jgi:hypothetical protein
MDMKSLRILGMLTCVLGLATTAFPQSDTAQISGFVKDATGAVVPSARVTLTNETTGLERNALSNQSGYYVVSNLPPGFYTLSVEAAGFKRFVKTQNKLDPNIATTVDAVLEIGEVTQTVEVVASVANIQSETATVGRLVESTQIDAMVLNGRNPLYLAMLKPGVRRGYLGFSYGLTSGGFSINGSRTQDNIVAFDGAVNMRTRANGTSIGTADLETVQEMQVLTADYNAEYGRASGGQIRFVTKSGSRNFHGSFYEYFRNEKLDANTWTRNRAGGAKDPHKFNQFGYILSGPVYIPGKLNTGKNKLFWLWGQEWARRRRGTTVTITVPSMAMRQGDFSELLNPSNTFFGKVRTVNDPTTGAPFANNVIPQSRLSSNGIGFLNGYPEPTAGFLQGTNNEIASRPQPANQRKDTLSLDFLPTEKHTFRFRLQNYGFFEAEAFRGSTDRAARTIDRPNRTYTLNHIYTVNPTTVNEFLASVSYDQVYLVVPNKEGKANRSRYGIDYPYIFPERKEIFDKIPTIDISNFQRLDGGPYPSKSSGPIYQLSDNMTKIMGSHTLKFGARYERAGQNDFDQINVSGVPGGTNNQNGRFVFDDKRAGAPTTGIAVANAAMGLFSTYAEIGPRAYTPYRSNMFEWFVQDSWKVTPSLRLELGLRHTWMQPYYYSLWRNMAVFDPNRYDPSKAVVQDPKTGNILSGDRYNGVAIPGTGWPDAAKGRVFIADTGEFDNLFTGGSKTWGDTHWKNFQPRIGVAYRIDDKTVVRSGVGRFFSRPGVSDNIFLGGNPPFQPMVSISNGLADNPGAGEATGFPQFFMTSDPVFKIPSAWNWNVAVQREVGFNTTVEVAYVGRVGLNMERVRDINQLQPGTLQDPANQGINSNVLRPFKGFAAINLGENAARSTYNGLQLNVNRRFSKGLLFGVAYTYSESKDNASGRRDQIYNNYDDRNYWGWSSFDSRHVMVTNFVYELPIFRDKTSLAGKLLGGWQLSGIMQFQTGTPVTIATNNDFAGIGVTNSQPWEVRGDPQLSGGEQAFSQGGADSNFFFRTADTSGNPLFTEPAPGTFSKTQNRNSLLHGPGFQSWNFGTFKDFAISERHRLQFRAEFFNLPNHPNWGSANTNPRSSTFGKVTSKTNERNIQLSLRYAF